MNYTLTDLIEVEQTQRLLQRFYDALGITTSIIDLEGNVLVSSRWRKICTDFHRVGEVTRSRCIAGDTVFPTGLLVGRDFSLYRCSNGLTNASSPIVIEGQHLANAFIGQFLTDKPDYAFFRSQAQQYGFNEAEYMTSLAEVPVITEEALTSILVFLTSFAEMIAGMGLRQLRQMETEERLRVTLASIGDAVISTDTLGIVTFLNPAAEALTGWNREDAIGVPVREVFRLVNGVTLQPAEDIAARVLRGDSVLPMADNTSLLTRHGCEIRIEDSVAQIRDGRDNISGVVLVFHDVTEKRRAQETIKRHSELLRLAFDAVIVWRPDGGIETWNLGAEELYGFREDEVKRCMTHDVLQSVYPVPWVEIENMLCKCGRWEGEVQHTTRNGRKVIVSSRLLRMIGEDACECILEINRDITAQKQNDMERELLIEALKASKRQVEFQTSELEAGTRKLRTARDQLEQRVRERTAELITANKKLQEQATLMDLAHDAIIVRDLCDNILYWNSGAEKLYSHSRRHALGKTLQDLLHTKSSEANKAVAACLNKTGTWEGELEHTTGVGRSIIVQSRQAQLQDADSVPFAILQIDRDITASRHLEMEVRRRRDELVHLDRVATMAELASSLAHELGQPLAGIMSNAQAARRFLCMGRDFNEVEAALADIIDDSQRAGNVIRKLRSMLKKQATGTSTLDINTVVTETVKLVRSDAIQKKVTVETDLDPDLPLVAADRVQLQQVLINLILNGFDALGNTEPNSRKIIVRTGRDGTGPVMVSVSDTGPVVEEEIMSRIFESFFTTKPEGLGMGLSISRTIIESHGGRLWAARNPGTGLTFHFSLPRTE